MAALVSLTPLWLLVELVLDRPLDREDTRPLSEAAGGIQQQPVSTRAAAVERGAAAPAALRSIAGENQRPLHIRRKLEQQGLPPRVADRLRVERRAIAPGLSDYIRDPLHWLPELQKASSTLLMNGASEPTMLQLTRLADDSVLHEFGIAPGDVILLVDENIERFGRRRLFRHSERLRDALRTLEQGGRVSITVLRAGTPVHLTYFSR